MDSKIDHELNTTTQHPYMMLYHWPKELRLGCLLSLVNCVFHLHFHGKLVSGGPKAKPVAGRWKVSASLDPISSIRGFQAATHIMETTELETMDQQSDIYQDSVVFITGRSVLPN